MKAALLDKIIVKSSEFSKQKNYLACERKSVSPTMTGETMCLLSTNAPKIFFMKGISSQHSRKQRAGKFLYSIFNTANAALGTGVLGFPFAYRQSGLILGILITIGSAGLMGYCLTVILRCARQFEGESYQQMVLLMYGRNAEQCLISMIIFINFMSGIAYLLVINSQVFYFVERNNSFLASYPFIMTIAVALAVPPSQFRCIDSLGSTSMVGVTAVMFFVAVIIVHGFLDPHAEDVSLFDLEPRAIQTIPIVFFAIFCHITIVPATAQLGQYWPSKTRPGKTRFKSLVTACVLIMTLCMLMYAPTGIAGYLLFGSETKGNVLENLGRGLDISISRVCMVVTTFASLPVTTILTRGASFDLLKIPNDIETLRMRDITIFNAAYYGLTLFIAMILRHFNQGIDFVMSIVGSTSGVSIQIGFPALFLWTMGKRVKSVVLLTLGVGLGLSGLFTTIVLAACGNNKSGFCSFTA